jgi:ribokinase
MEPQLHEHEHGKLTVVGSINVDLTWTLGIAAQVSSPISPGYTWSATSRQGLGGKGANAAIYAAGLHGPIVELIGAIGDDHLASFCRSELQRAGITLTLEEHADTTTGRAGIISDHRGQNLIAVDLGANQLLTPGFVEANMEETLPAPSVIVTNFEIGPEAALATANFALRHRITLIVDPSPLNQVDAFAPVLEQASILLPNELEYEILQRDYSELLDRQQLLGGYVAVTLGERGVDIYHQHVLAQHFDALAVPVADSIGAGDCFTATLGACLALGIDRNEAFQLATTAASLSTQGFGAQGYLPTLREAYAARQGLQ